MKNKFLLIILFTNLLIAQEFDYKFDAYTIYRNTNLFINSANQDYYMYLYDFEGKLISKLIDLKNKKTHFFDVKKNNDDYSFSYIVSKYNSGHNEKYFPFLYYEINTINEFQNGKIIDFKLYKNKRKKKIFKHYELELEKNETNLFHAFRICFAHPYENFKNFNINENYLVKKITILNEKDNKIYNLIHYKKINLSLIIQKILYNEQ